MKKVFASLQCAALLAALVFPTLTTYGSTAAQGGPEFVPGQLIVQFRAGVSDEDKVRALGRANAVAAEKIAEAFAHGLDKGDLVLADFPGMMLIKAARRSIEQDPAVEFAEPNWIYAHQATSNDTYYGNGSLWGMYGDASSPANQFGSQAAEAWAAGHNDCSGVYVGIIDEGFMDSHEDLQANTWTNPYDPVDGIDNDGNGYADDVHGWDFDGGNNSTFDGTSDDHGTHVAGTIGGVGGNGKGVAGVCWSVKLISGKFLGRRGGTTANAIKAVNYFTDLKTRHGLNLVATNNSWGGGGFSQALKDAIDRAGAANILFIAAAGNDSSNNDSSASYPSGYTSSNIIAVASITSTGTLSSFSNYGATTVDIGAPGSSIYSSLPKSSKGEIVSGYGSYSGTSMATPHVTGGAALYASTHPGATADQIRSAILGSAVPTASLSGKTTTGGRLNVSGF
jgi:subtilisin family serine protease